MRLLRSRSLLSLQSYLRLHGRGGQQRDAPGAEPQTFAQEAAPARTDRRARGANRVAHARPFRTAKPTGSRERGMAPRGRVRRAALHVVLRGDLQSRVLRPDVVARELP